MSGLDLGLIRASGRGTVLAPQQSTALNAYGPLREGYATGGVIAPATVPEGSGAGAVSVAGWVAMAIGAIGDTVGAVGQVQASKRLADVHAESLRHEARMAAHNARRAEVAAQAAIEAGRLEAQRFTMRAGQRRGARRAARGGRGIRMNTGSAAEVEAGHRLSEEIDRMTIDMNAVYASGARRSQAVSFANEGISRRQSAENLRATARGLDPALTGATGALSGATRLASEWLRYQR